MSKKKVELGKRIFNLYFYGTISVILLIAIIVWGRIDYAVKQYENTLLIDEINEIQTIELNVNKELHSEVQELSYSRHIIKSVESGNLEALSFALSYLIHPLSENLIILEAKKNILFTESDFGIPLELLKELTDINEMSAILGHHDLYYVAILPLYSNNYANKLIGYIIGLRSGQSMLKDMKTKFDNISLIIPGSQDLTTNKNYMRSEKNYKSLLENGEAFGIFRDSFVKGSAIALIYDSDDRPIAYYLNSYQRNYNKLLQKSILFFIFTVLSLMLITIAFMAHWFRLRIMSPIREITQGMKMIIKNPDEGQLFIDTYTGDLNEIVSTYNLMNKSITDYSRSLGEYKIITEHLSGGIFWLDNDFKIILCNPGLCDIFEIPDRADIVGKNLNIFIKFTSYMLKELQKGTLKIQEFKFTINNKVKYVDVYCKKIVEGNEERYVGYIEDISSEYLEKSARENLEIKLIAANKLAEIGRRVEGIVHNFNSPLNSIMGYGQLLKKDLPENEDVKYIISSANRISDGVKAILSKIQSESNTTKYPLDINSLVKTELEFFVNNLFFKHNVNLSTEYEESLPAVYSMYSDVSQCFSNILNNAIDALKQAPVRKIDIKTFSEDMQVIIQISDTGEGINEENMERIFEPSFTTKSGKEYTGFGLGLAITKNILQTVNGTISIDSQPGQGTTFKLFFPKYQDEDKKN